MLWALRNWALQIDRKVLRKEAHRLPWNVRRCSFTVPVELKSEEISPGWFCGGHRAVLSDSNRLRVTLSRWLWQSEENRNNSSAGSRTQRYGCHNDSLARQSHSSDGDINRHRSSMTPYEERRRPGLSPVHGVHSRFPRKRYFNRGKKIIFQKSTFQGAIELSNNSTLM